MRLPAVALRGFGCLDTQAGDLVDVQGTSIGKGFQGGIKRHHFARGLMTHGSKSHRQVGAPRPPRLARDSPTLSSSSLRHSLITAVALLLLVVLADWSIRVSLPRFHRVQHYPWARVPAPEDAWAHGD